MNPEQLARTPPMGWNSWDCYGTTVTEDEVMANAEFMAGHLLLHGWDTVVVDIQWYEPTARAGGYNPGAALVLDEFGRHLPAENRFPSAAKGQGFAPLARKIHALGLKFGLHIMRGIPRQAVEQKLPVAGTPYTANEIADTSTTCAWNSDNYGLNHVHPGAQAYYDSQLELFAGWGVDFVKADDMIGPYFADDISAYRKAVQRCGRSMLLSLSPGRALSTAHLGHLRTHAEMWRVSDDLWDVWSDVKAQFARMARWAPYQQAGSWADADMLPVGRIALRAERRPERLSRLTMDEQRAMLTLWCISRSPLMLGCDLPTSPPETLELLTNPAVLEVHKHSRGGREIVRELDTVIWSAESDRSADKFIATFNIGDESMELSVPLGDLGLGEGASWDNWEAREAWTGLAPASLQNPPGDLLTLNLAPHSAALFRFNPKTPLGPQ